MLDVLLYVLPVIVVIAGAFLLYSLYPAAFPAFLHHKTELGRYRTHRFRSPNYKN